MSAGVRDGDGAVACLACSGTDVYPRTVLRALLARVDRRIADLMLARVRRRWPLLRLLPRACVRQAVLPAARVARHDILSVVVIVILFAGMFLALVSAF